MTVSPSVLQAHAATAVQAFTIGEAALIFVVAVVVVTVIVAIAGRRTRRLAFRPRLRTAHSRRIHRAAEEDIETIEQDARQYRPEVPERPVDEL